MSIEDFTQFGLDNSQINIVVGAGFSGATIANLIATELNEKVILIDKKNHLAGNSFDYRDENGIMVHKYGSHIFHTEDENVWQFLNKFTTFNNYSHQVLGFIDGAEIHIPFNFNSLYQVFNKEKAEKLEKKLLDKFEFGTKVSILEFQNQDDEDLKALAQHVYEKIFLNYTIKQWGLKPNEIDKSVVARVPVYLSRDNRYFQDKYQGIPKDGYSRLIENMINHPNIEIRLNTDFKEFQEFQGEYKRIFYTGSIDEFFNYEFGVLPYRSVNFELEVHNREFYQSNSVINYPNTQSWTRIHEYKYYLKDKSPKTVIAKEFSEFFELGKNERYYPIVNEANLTLYNKYLCKAKSLKNVYFLGRLGDYKYYNMDMAVGRAFELFREIKNGI